MGARPRHPNKEIEAAVSAAIEAGWTWTISSGHAWGRLWCPKHDRDGCRISVWSTPKHPQAHASDIARAVSRCNHCGKEASDEGV